MNLAYIYIFFLKFSDEHPQTNEKSVLPESTRVWNDTYFQYVLGQTHSVGMLEVEYQTLSGFLHSLAATVCMYILVFQTCMGKKQEMCVVSKPYGFISKVYILLKYTVM